jgi:hypothetical protein
MNTRGVTDEWTMALRCPDCALVGVARLSKANRAASKVDHLPEGFEFVVTDHGDTFYCVTCNRRAKAVIL